ncbi:MAG TPA: 3'-5' exonuclease [Oscillospiraceae bacterium]|nr:3'-5' exonuclease [Oscillospiraceae bacterium]HPF55098.1 3'-5' exonuclease [Clostridiales bacterium]HPK34414.1 3'-5' exonuclease [Oscillospiraceae bacterium]HPR75601.1 3'-5' exonuclease [Oscillospiraceae bacterium]
MDISRFNEYKREALQTRFASLNPQQREAVFCVKGPLLILAGAGSGKTTVLINRIAYLLKFGNAFYSEKIPENLTENDFAFLEHCAKNGVASVDDERFARIVSVDAPPPWSILAITFTNKAAQELRDRLERSVGAQADSILASTFHSACVRFLRRDIERIGMAGNFTIYDSDDSTRMVKQIIGDLAVDDRNFAPKTVKNTISAAKNDFILPDDYAESAGNDYYKQIVYKIYVEYQKRLRDNNALDFDDILLHTVKLFEENPDILEHYQNKFQYIFVDEYQDTNMVQYKLVSLLAQKHGNLCVVGDDDQSIYKFRGATIENILSFEHHFPNATVIRLEQNYRSTANILDSANAVIAKNTSRKGKTLWTSGGKGDKVLQRCCADERDEANFIVSEIQSAVKNGSSYSDFAILYRVNAISTSLERALVGRGIPYRVFGGLRFYDRKEIKDMLAYLALINNSADELRLRRIVNEPKRGIGDGTLDNVKKIALEQNLSMMDVIFAADQYAALSAKAKLLTAFGNMIADLRGMLESGKPISEVYYELLQQSGYLTMLEAGGFTEQGRIENVTELLSEIKKYEQSAAEPSLDGFLEDCALMTDFDNYDESAEAVILMTVHGAKGLEFDTVFVAACEENVFPSYLSLFEQSEIEEERRLAYVAFTRAKKRLVLTHCTARLLYGSTSRNKLSRFAEDIPEEFKTVYKPQIDIPSGGYVNFSKRPQRPGSYQAPGQPNTSRPAPYATPTPRPATGSSQKFTVGQRVTHPSFGPGMITKVSPMGGDTLLEIAFDTSGTKRIMANFARLKS